MRDLDDVNWFDVHRLLKQSFIPLKSNLQQRKQHLVDGLRTSEACYQLEKEKF